MVGHTGDLKATIKACTTVDEAVTVRAKIYNTVEIPE